MTSSEKLNTLCLHGRWDALDPTQDDPIGWDLRRGNRLGSSEEGGMQEFLNKIWKLGEGTAHDACGWSNSKQVSSADIVESIARSRIYRASTPRGTCTLFRTLYTNACSFDCAYCINSADKRETYSYTPKELARVFHQLYTRNLVEGLFLSSSMGVDPETTMEEMIRAVGILRNKYRFPGYIHLKILPGASRYHIKRAVQLVNRVSLNVEEPSGSRLAEVAPVKDYGIDILRRQAWVMDLASHLPSGQATQFIVGATDETDLEIISSMHKLYEDMQMRRIYYSAFEPVPETKLQSKEGTPSWREHRLYQVDWLYRVYHYPMEEILEALTDDLLPNRDPKITLARLFLDEPVEVNEASREELLRVPGIGPRSASRIIALRRKGARIRSRRRLAEIGVVVGRAQPFLKIDGNYQARLEDWF